MANKELNGMNSTLSPNTPDEFKRLCQVMNALPGIKVRCTTSYPFKGGVRIWFDVVGTNKDGLFLLARSVDRRYWEYGHSWNIKVDVHDTFKNGHLPLNYTLNEDTSGAGTRDIPTEIEAMIESIHWHLNHKNFISGFNIDLSKFDIIKDDGKHSLFSKNY